MLESVLEMKVLSAVDALRNGLEGEADLIEFKAIWPDALKPKFIRQLAGSLNRAGGENIVVVVGINNEDGKYTKYESPDMAKWWPSVQSGFDQIPPELTRDINVDVGGGEIVRALAISSSRAPYVIKTGQDPYAREIPIREGTRTRSAFRDEIIRMLIPAVRLPRVEVLSADLKMIERYAYGDVDDAFNPGDPGGVMVAGLIKVFVEPQDESPITVPRHLIRADAAFSQGSVTLNSPGWASSKNPDPSLSVTESTDGYRINFPGTLAVELRASYIDWPTHRDSIHDEKIQLIADLPISGLNRSVKMNIELTPSDMATMPDGSSEVIAHWSFRYSQPD